MSRFKFSTDGAIEELSRGVHNKETSMDRKAIEHLETFSMDREAIETNSQKLWWIEIAITTIEKGKSRGSIDSLAVERFRDAVEIAQKQFFKKRKT